jgi:putative membrane protein
MNYIAHIHHHGQFHGTAAVLPFLLAVTLYIWAGVRSARRFRPFPAHRYAFWILGVLSAAAAVVGPLPNQAHTDFNAHMLVHLLLGMLAPLFLVLAAPMTLLLQTCNVKFSRKLSRFLKIGPVRMLTDPAIASLFNIGGLWLLYSTNLYYAMQLNLLLHIIVHLHIFLAGYLFTASMISIDPVPHRPCFAYRTVVLLVALTGHAILAKYIYANPPTGVPVEQAERGSLLMYYGGDIVDAFLISILFYRWFKAPRLPVKLNLVQIERQ